MKQAKILLIVLMVVMLVAKCGDSSEELYKKGDFGYTNNPLPIMLGVKAEKDTFKIDDVELDLYYGLFDEEYWMRRKEEAEPYYCAGEDDEVVFAIYICSISCLSDIATGRDYEDYKNIDEHFFVKEIKNQEAFVEEFAYSMTYSDGVTYNHSERIVIPQDLFREDKGGVVIEIVAYAEPRQEDEDYHSLVMSSLELNYEIKENGEVKLTSLQKD